MKYSALYGITIFIIMWKPCVVRWIDPGEGGVETGTGESGDSQVNQEFVLGFMATFVHHFRPLIDEASFVTV